MDYDLVFDPKAEKYLKKLLKKDKKTAQMLLDIIKKIHDNPYESDILKGYWAKSRKLRKGDYRIIFDIDNNSNPKEIVVLKIGKRNTIYKTS